MAFHRARDSEMTQRSHKSVDRYRTNMLTGSVFLSPEIASDAVLGILGQPSRNNRQRGVFEHHSIECQSEPIGLPIKLRSSGIR